MTTPVQTKHEPLSLKLREKAEVIDKLLTRYYVLRYGDKDYAQGNDIYRKDPGKYAEMQPLLQQLQEEIEKFKSGKHSVEETIVAMDKYASMRQSLLAKSGYPPGTSGTPPQIAVVSSPQNLFLRDEEMPQTEEKNEGVNAEVTKPRVVNPLLQALSNLGELTYEESHQFELDVKYNILVELGIQERYKCAVLFSWARRLAATITYIFETRELYSPEIKAVYPELLTDLESGRAECDKLAHLLGKQGGILTRKQFEDTISRILHFAEIAKSAALQLADDHDEFMGATGKELYDSKEIKWVKEKEGETPAEATSDELGEEEKEKKK